MSSAPSLWATEYVFIFIGYILEYKIVVEQLILFYFVVYGVAMSIA
jgi:hypothetical protein